MIVMDSPKVKMKISDKVKGIPEALSVYFNNIVYEMKRRGANIITLSLGEAYFDVPFYGFKDIDIKKGFHYSESLGLPGLRYKIADYYNTRYGASVDGDKEILISAGSKPLIYMALQTVLNSGDEVLIHDPEWLSYAEQIKLANGVPVYIPYDCKPCDFEKYINDKVKVLIINNPNNPAGFIYTRDDLEKLYKVCRSRGIYILADEAYSDFVIDNSFVSLLNIVPDKDGIIVVNSLSKNFGISGWRIGYVISDPEIIYNILKLNQHLITCTSTVLLMYVEKYFEELLQYTLPQAKAVTIKRNKIEQYVRKQGLKTLGGASTFYIFISIDNYRWSSIDLALYLLFKYNIAVVPGSAYGKSTERFIRVGVGVEKEETMYTAILVIKKVISKQEFDNNLITHTLNKFNIHRF